jgi:tRNA threonylcarbamoyl adenosine modification protein YeaZ
LGSDPLILGFDTTAAHCAAVLLSGHHVVAEAREEMTRGQAERLVPILQAVLAQAGAGPEDLAALGVGIGPGNFTGTRIAVATARGLALARGIPAVGVSGFEALALGANAPVLACLDARQGRVYVASVVARGLYGADLASADLKGAGSDGAGTDGAEVRGAGGPKPAADLYEIAALPAAGLPAGRLCLGDHAEAVAAATGGRAGRPACGTAEAIARIAAARHAEPGLARPAPIYLRPPAAAPASDPAPAILP